MAIERIDNIEQNHRSSCLEVDSAGLNAQLCRQIEETEWVCCILAGILAGLLLSFDFRCSMRISLTTHDPFSDIKPKVMSSSFHDQIPGVFMSCRRPTGECFAANMELCGVWLLGLAARLFVHGMLMGS